MSSLFLHLLNISITAGWIVLVVVLLRFVLKKAPKWMCVVLWGLVALRLILPVSIESVTSLVPSAETVKIESVARVTPSDPSSVPASAAGERIVVETGIPIMNSAVSPIAERTAEHTDTVATVKTVAGWVWLAGACAMLLYALISFLRLKHRVRASVLLEKGVYVCDEIKDPFILGLLFPKIYLPSGMDEATRAYVLAHERAHLKRFDHIWKPLGFLLLAVYWFNPLLWLAYILLCRDVELACDEKVVKELDDTGKAAYSEALVTASVSRRSIAACPLAFGETGVKSRVKSVLNYKKPAFWIILAAILCCIAVAVCFLTVPKKKENTYVGTWELSKLITEGQEFDAAFLTMFGMDKDTIVLDADGTGKRVTETNGEISEWTATYTVNGNELEIVFVLSETSGSSGYRITKAAAYDPKSDTLSLVNEYETYIYIRAGGEQPVPDASLTVEKLVGVWRTDGIKLSDDEPGMLSGTLIFRKDGSAGLNLSAGSGAMQEECTFTLNGNTIELTSRGQTAPVSYDPAHDTLSLPMMNIGILTFKRTDEPFPDLNETMLCSVWTLYELEAPDGSNGDPRALGIEQYLDFRSDGIVHFVERNLENYSEGTASYSFENNTVMIEGSSALTYDPDTGDMLLTDPISDDIAIWRFYRTPYAELPLTEARFVGAWTIESMDLNGTDVTEEDAYRTYRGLTVELYRSGNVLIDGRSDHRWEPGFTWSFDGNNTVILKNNASGSELSLSCSNDLLILSASDLFDEAEPDLRLTLKRDPTIPLPSETIPVSPVSPAPESAVTEWLDYYEKSSEMPWGDAKEIAIDAFPDVTFRWTSGSVEAIENGKTRTLFSGMPVWSVYFTDLTGDGKPELCATVSFGSGIVDEHIVVYDYANKQSYTLWDRGTFDYHLTTADDALQVSKLPYNNSTAPLLDTGALLMHDGVLSCRWQSDGSYAPLLPELHESELYGEWLVEEETDNDGNVLYTFAPDDLWKEYSFREDGTVVYNETVPSSSDSEKAFGHPVEYPYEVHDGYVYIDDGRSTSGYLDPQTRKLELNYQHSPGQYVYATLKRMGE